MPPSRARTKVPVEVEYMEFTSETWPELNAWLAEWVGEEKFYILISGRKISLHLETLEGDRDCDADTGYRIIKGTQGEPYPIGPEAFAAKYEQVVS